MASTTDLSNKVKVLAPLSDFPWDGESFSIPGFCSILSRGAVSQHSECPQLLSHLHESDQADLGTASHWLVFEQDPNESANEANKINMFLLALWLIAPTRTHVRFRASNKKTLTPCPSPC